MRPAVLRTTGGMGQHFLFDEKNAMSMGTDIVVLSSWLKVVQALDGPRMRVIVGGEAAMLDQRRLKGRTNRIISRLRKAPVPDLIMSKLGDARGEPLKRMVRLEPRQAVTA